MVLRVIFMGTPDFSVPTLTEIVGAGHDVCAVYSQPPRPAGRGMAERPTPVSLAAEQFGLEVKTPTSLKDEHAIEEFRALDADIAVVVAYGLILPQPILDTPRMGCVNLHASLLPRWRGAAPIQRAIMAGDAGTGVAVMQMEAGLDTGPVGMVERVAISANMTAGELHDVLAVRGGDLMHRALGAIERDSLAFVPQTLEGVTYANKIDKGEARIAWDQDADIVHNRIRGLSPFPGAWCELKTRGKTERLKILKSKRVEGTGSPGTVLDDALTIACGTGAVRLVSVQRAGKTPVSAEDFLRGVDLSAGNSLG